jgi:hypothetical protein
MTTPSVPTKPEVSDAEPGPERRQDDAPAPRERASSPQAEARRAAPRGEQGGERHQMVPQVLGSLPSDRAVDADLLIDIPQLSVEELTLELDASLLLNRVKLDAKGLEAGLYVKANFDHIVELTQQGSGAPEGRVSDRQRGSDIMRARTGLRELLGATRDAYRDLSDRDVQRQLQGVHASAREAYARITTEDEPAHERQPDADGAKDEAEREHNHDGNGGRSRPVRERARHAVTQGAKAAGLTAAGLAGGALLESHSKPSRKLSISGRRKRARAIRHAIAKRLP